VIPREGVERLYRGERSGSHKRLVIPREGVESMVWSTPIHSSCEKPVIPREGVESLILLLCSNTKTVSVIPREGVESTHFRLRRLLSAVIE